MIHHHTLSLALLHFSTVVANYEDNAYSAINTLQSKWYNSNTGLWNGLWWQSGNMVATIAKFGTQDSSFKHTASDIVANTYAKAPLQNGGSFKNGFYDDEGWWALGWINTYDLTGDPKYLNTAKDIFEDMIGGWTTPCNGGIWWDKAKTSIASISNELFLSVAAHLANRSSGADKNTYLFWALMEWDWFSRSGVINSDNVINDGIDKGNCKNNGQTVFTYNQGVLLGGLAEITKATADSQYINAAKKIADGAIKSLTVNGILTEQSPTLDQQSAQFKGVFVRGLAELIAQSPQQSYTDFLKRNADSVLSKAWGSDGLIEARWQGGAGEDGVDQTKTTSQAAGIDLLVATAQAI